MTDQPLNGSEQPDPLSEANKRFAEAYLRSLTPGGQFTFGPKNMMQLLAEFEVLKINFDMLLQACVQGGMDKTAFDARVIAVLDAQAEHYRTTPTVVQAPADALRRRR